MTVRCVLDFRPFVPHDFLPLVYSVSVTAAGYQVSGAHNVPFHFVPGPVL
jgi:hypothetical protein